MTTHSNTGVDEVLRKCNEKCYVDQTQMLNKFVRVGGGNYKAPDDVKQYEINEKVLQEAKRRRIEEVE